MEMGTIIRNDVYIYIDNHWIWLKFYIVDVNANLDHDSDHDSNLTDSNLDTSEILPTESAGVSKVHLS